jgi:hypothetical protein
MGAGRLVKKRKIRLILPSRDMIRNFVDKDKVITCMKRKLIRGFPPIYTRKITNGPVAVYP